MKKCLIILNRFKEEAIEISKNIEFPIIETGKYRVEIEQKNKGFAYSNPIIVY